MTLVHLDTNSIILGNETTSELAEAFQGFMLKLREMHRGAVTSELTLAELLAPTRRGEALPLAERASLYGSLLLHAGIITLLPVSRRILLESANLRARFPLKLIDAIHVASVLDAGCTFFMSNDARPRSLPASLWLVAADAQGVRTVLTGQGLSS